MNFQTHMRKVAVGVLSLAKTPLPTIAIYKGIDDPNMSCCKAAFYLTVPSIQKLSTLKEMLASAKDNIEKTAYTLAAAMR